MTMLWCDTQNYVTFAYMWLKLHHTLTMFMAAYTCKADSLVI